MGGQTVSAPVVVTIRRGQIKKAGYNPRKIEAGARGKLKAGLEEFGNVELLVWNKRTGTLVGGHQRLEILDERNGPDYSLAVSQVDLDPKRERQLNLLLNNPKAQGAWDDEKLLAVLKEIDGDLAVTGFDDAEQLGRKCRGIEIEPKYVAVTLQRWADATGKVPKLKG